MPESKFSKAKKQIEFTDIKKQREALRAKLDNLFDKLAGLVKEFEETRKQMEQIPGTVYYERAHPEMFPEKAGRGF